MEKHTLKAIKRTIAGRKVKKLRHEGNIPGNIYGKKIKSHAVQLSEKELLSVYAKVGETGLVELVVDGEVRPVLIHNIQLDPVSSRPLHVDFHQVDLREKVTTKVPLEMAGESPAVKDKVGVLLNIMSEVEVEALPADLPEKIEVDVSVLASIDQAIKVADLKISDKVKILTDQALEMVKVAPLVSKEAEKMAAEEAAAAAAAATAAPAAGGEGAVQEAGGIASTGGNETKAAQQGTPVGGAASGPAKETGK